MTSDGYPNIKHRKKEWQWENGLFRVKPICILQTIEANTIISYKQKKKKKKKNQKSMSLYYFLTNHNGEKQKQTEFKLKPFIFLKTQMRITNQINKQGERVQKGMR